MLLPLLGLGIQVSLHEEQDVFDEHPSSRIGLQKSDIATDGEYDPTDFNNYDMEFSYSWLRPLPDGSPLPARLIRKIAIWWRNTF